MTVQISPRMYSQIVDECDELARDYATGEEHESTMENDHND